MSGIFTGRSRPELVTALETNWRAALKTFGYAPQVEIYDTPELFWFITRIPSGAFNAVQYSRLPAPRLNAVIEGVIDHFSRQGVPFSWMTGPGTRPVNTGLWLEDYGFRQVAEVEAMAADMQNPAPLRPISNRLAIEPVRSAEDLRDWIEVECAGFEVAAAERPGLVAVRQGIGWHPGLPLVRLLGRWEGRPVAVSTFIPGGGVAGVYDVATLPEARGQGIGTAMTLAAMRLGQASGYRFAVLQPTRQGRPVYQRLGFKACGQFKAYAYFGDRYLEDQSRLI